MLSFRRRVELRLKTWFDVQVDMLSVQGLEHTVFLNC